MQAHRILLVGIALALASVGILGCNAGQELATSADELNARSYDDFAAKIEVSHAQSIEAALDLLPPAMRSNFTLMHDSRSLQGSSMLDPRAILFSEDGSFFVTFNGNPSQSGYAELEMMQFRESTKKFEFRVISFSPGSSPVVSEANPARCLTCHGSDPIPIWEDYFAQWPGAYGANHDTLSAAEAAAYRTFRAHAAESGRYSKLSFESTSQHFPYQDELQPPIVHSLRFRPNQRMSLLLARRVAQRSVDALRRSPLYEKYRALIVYRTMKVYSSGYSPLQVVFPFPEDVSSRLREIVRTELRGQGIDDATIASLSDPLNAAEIVALNGASELSAPPFQTTPWLRQYAPRMFAPWFVGGELLRDLMRDDPESVRFLYLRSLKDESADATSHAWSYYHDIPEFASTLDRIASAPAIDPAAPAGELPLQQTIRRAFGL
jgi:hypothetical protein